MVKKILRKNQIMITALAVMIAVAGYLNFAGTKIGEEDFISVDGSNSELTYEISDEDMYAISLREDTDGVITDYSEYAAVTGTEADIASLDTDDTTITDNYLKVTWIHRLLPIQMRMELPSLSRRRRERLCLPARQVFQHLPVQNF